VIVAAAALLLAALTAPAAEEEDKGETYVLEKNAAKLPYDDGGNGGNRGRMKAFLAALPDGYKAEVKFITLAPGGTPITFLIRLTPLNAEGKPDGIELHFCDWYTEPTRKVPFKNGLKHGTELIYATKQVLNVEAKRTDHVRYVETEVPWENGVLNGVQKSYHATGKLASETSYDHGEITGEARSYTDEGELLRVVRYEKGRKHGDMVDYWPKNGNVKRSVPYVAGQVKGVAKEFYLSGQLKWERPFKDNVQHGIEKHYEADGKLETMLYWLEGQEVTKEELDAKFKP